jgi:hypothetical protein
MPTSSPPARREALKALELSCVGGVGGICSRQGVQYRLKITFGGYNSKVRNCLKRAFSVQKVPQDMIEYRRQMD